MGRVACLVVLGAACGGEEPTAPLPFSHRAHVVRREMACVECHAGVETEAWAGMPTTEDCLGCHAFRFTDDARALAVTDLAGKVEPDPWPRRYAIAAHAHVSHAAHAAAKVPCEKCHGGTGKGEVVRREMMLAGEALMGWCIECHEHEEASVDCLTCHR